MISTAFPVGIYITLEVGSFFETNQSHNLIQLSASELHLGKAWMPNVDCISSNIKCHPQTSGLKVVKVNPQHTKDDRIVPYSLYYLLFFKVIEKVALLRLPELHQWNMLATDKMFLYQCVTFTSMYWLGKAHYGLLKAVSKVYFVI